MEVGTTFLSQLFSLAAQARVSVASMALGVGELKRGTTAFPALNSGRWLHSPVPEHCHHLLLLLTVPHCAMGPHTPPHPPAGGGCH